MSFTAVVLLFGIILSFAYNKYSDYRVSSLGEADYVFVKTASNNTATVNIKKEASKFADHAVYKINEKDVAMASFFTFACYTLMV